MHKVEHEMDPSNDRCLMRPARSYKRGEDKNGGGQKKKKRRRKGEV
jgi:hypothetical protein